MSTRYVLHDSIGSGGMATVHVGHLHAPLGFTRVVAIKRLHPALSRQAEFAAMLVDEARITARVRHLNVIPTLDVFLEKGECFLVMEYVEGESLAKLLRSASQVEAPVPLGVVSSVLCGVLQGLHAAHVARAGSGEPLGIIHRDVSPQNIIVGSDGIARVFDFGVAKAFGRLQQTRAGEFKGKLPYLAPEQFRDGKLDRRVDVYAASVTLWETLTTRRLFDGSSEEEVFGKILQSRIPTPSELRPDIPPALDELVLRGLSRSPDERFASAADMALALERAVPPAAPREVAAWLQLLAGDALAKRAALVIEIDGGTRAAGVDAQSAPGVALAPTEPSAALIVTPPAAVQPLNAISTPSPHSLTSPAVTQRITVPLPTTPRTARLLEAPGAPAIGNAATYEAEAPTLLALGSSTPPPLSLSVVEPSKPRRVAARALLGIAVALCSLAATAFGWMALGAREPAHGAAAHGSLPSAAKAAPITLAPSPASPSTFIPSTPQPRSTSTNLVASSAASGVEAATPPAVAVPKLPAAAKPSAAAKPAAIAPKPAAVAPKPVAVAVAPKPAAVAPKPAAAAPKPRTVIAPATKSDYLSTAPFAQRR
jgi:eukaryotic-like serine/threonine-protein kinase